MMGEFGGPFQVSQLTAVYVVDSTMDQRLFWLTAKHLKNKGMANDIYSCGKW